MFLWNKSKRSNASCNDCWRAFDLKNKLENMKFIATFNLPGLLLTLSWRRSLTYRNQSVDSQSKSVDWILYDRDLRHERVGRWVLYSLLQKHFKNVKQRIKLKNSRQVSLIYWNQCISMFQYYVLTVSSKPSEVVFQIFQNLCRYTSKSLASVIESRLNCNVAFF